MGLADLKKNHSGVNKAEFTADEFIEDALFYANGSPKVISMDRVVSERMVCEADVFGHNHTHRHNHREPFKRATFTLSDEAIAALNQYAHFTELSKSRLVRLFVHYVSNLSSREREEVFRHAGHLR